MSRNRRSDILTFTTVIFFICVVFIHFFSIDDFSINYSSSHTNKVIQIRVDEDFPVENGGINSSIQNPALWIPTSKYYRVEQKNPTFQWLYNDNSTLMFSAHYDHRDVGIKITGFRNRFIKPPEKIARVHCLFPDGIKTPLRIYYNISVMFPRPGLVYNSFVWICAMNSPIIPTSVKVISSQKVLDMPVTYKQDEGMSQSRRLLICVKPVVHNYNNKYQLIEFLETSRILGAGKVVLYPYEMNPSLNDVVDKYVKQGLVDVVTWKPPVPLDTMHAFGQKTHNQHCLYSNMYNYQWISFIDLDELIVPNNQPNYERMIQEIVLAQPHNNLGSMTLLSQLCAVTVEDDPIYKTNHTMCKATCLRKTNCTIPMPLGKWSKPVVRTIAADIVDIHFIRKGRPGFIDIALNASFASVHHYREVTEHTNIFQAFGTNYHKPTLHKFTDQITEKMGDLCAEKNFMVDEQKFNNAAQKLYQQELEEVFQEEQFKKQMQSNY